MKEFEVTEEHLTLLKAMCVGWNDCEFGAPEIDPKRPYGNSYVVADMVQILGIPTYAERHGDVAWSPETEDRLRKLHAETKTALQVCLAVGSFTAGRYVAEDYGRKWRLVGA